MLLIKMLKNILLKTFYGYMIDEFCYTIVMFAKPKQLANNILC